MCLKRELLGRDINKILILKLSVLSRCEDVITLQAKWSLSSLKYATNCLHHLWAHITSNSNMSRPLMLFKCFLYGCFPLIEEANDSICFVFYGIDVVTSRSKSFICNVQCKHLGSKFFLFSMCRLCLIWLIIYLIVYCLHSVHNKHHIICWQIQQSKNLDANVHFPHPH